MLVRVSALPLLIAMLVFVLGHFVMSSRPIRSRVIDALGETRFAGLYSVIVGLALAGVIAGWTLAPFVPLWTAPLWTRWIPNALAPISIAFLVLGLSTPSPTAAGQGARAAEGARGIVRITRHPALWGFAMWAISHLLANGDLRSTIVFVGIATLALGGMIHIDARRAAAGAEAWERFRVETSVIPFAAILSGRQRLVVREIVGWRLLIAVAIWAATLHLHRIVIGVSPLP